jgi:hypothetical protein
VAREPRPRRAWEIQDVVDFFCFAAAYSLPDVAYSLLSPKSIPRMNRVVP